MRRHPRPFANLLTLLAFGLAAAVPGRGMPAASTVALGGAHSEIVAVPSVHAAVASVSVARKLASPAAPIAPCIAAHNTVVLGSALGPACESTPRGVDERGSHAFTYDATAPPNATR
jgi:hypothetical protein